jgi:hypothetical protein
LRAHADEDNHRVANRFEFDGSPERMIASVAPIAAPASSRSAPASRALISGWRLFVTAIAGSQPRIAASPPSAPGRI